MLLTTFLNNQLNNYGFFGLYSYGMVPNAIKLNNKTYTTDSNNYWSTLNPTSKWYDITINGYSSEYEKDNKSLSGIYIYRNKINYNECYIGLAFNLTDRFINHRWHVNAFKRGGYTSTPYFYSFVCKYGWNGFEIAVLEYVSVSDLISTENKYLSKKPVYNSMYYSINKQLSHTEETKQLLSSKLSGDKNPMRGISLKVSEERKKYLKSLVGKLNKNYGKSVDELTRKLISNSLLNPYYYLYKKDKESNNLILITKIKYIKYVAEYIGITPSSIRKWLNINELIKDYYVYSYDINIKPELTSTKLHKNVSDNYPLIVLDSSRDILEVFIGSFKIASYLGVNSGEVLLSIDQNILLDTPLQGPVYVESYNEVHSNPRARIIKFYFNDRLVQIYPSLKTAADSLGIKSNTLSSYISGKRPGNKYPYKFEQLVIKK